VGALLRSLGALHCIRPPSPHWRSSLLWLDMRAECPLRRARPRCIHPHHLRRY
jgi:hypothetical protein